MKRAPQEGSSIIVRAMVSHVRRRLVADVLRPVEEAGRIARALEEVVESLAQRDWSIN